MGSGTTIKVANELGRIGIGYEIELELFKIIKKKLNVEQMTLKEQSSKFEIIKRDDTKHLRTILQERVNNQRSVTKK